MGRRVTGRKIKANRQYKYDEAAEALGVSVPTVRAWRAQGLRVLVAQKPHLIVGADLKAFLDNRRTVHKRVLGPDEVLCMSCKVPVKPFGMMVDYVGVTTTRGWLETLCGVCEGRCIRIVSAEDLPKFGEFFHIATRSDERT